MDDGQLIVQTWKVALHLRHRHTTEVVDGALGGHLAAGIHHLGQQIDADVLRAGGELLALAFSAAVTDDRLAVDGVEQVDADGIALRLGQIGDAHDGHRRGGLAFQLGLGGTLVGSFAGQRTGEGRSLDDAGKQRRTINFSG